MSTLSQRRTGGTAPVADNPFQQGSVRVTKATAVQPSNSFFSPNVSKAHGEKFFLGWGVVWISLMAYIVATRWFETFTDMSYMYVGLLIALPPIILPFLFPGSDASIPWHQRYTTKANVWIFIMSWMANYFWTHYFYHVLGTSYIFSPTLRLNDVPFALYLITHSYFHFYHVLSNMALRLAWRQFNNRTTICSLITISILIAIMSYVVSFMETFTIQNFPYYHIPDRWAMYVYGSMFYALYFIVSFPLIYRMDEDVNVCWSLERATIEGFANSMLITQALDFWRITIGPIVDLDMACASARAATPPAHLELIQPPACIFRTGK